MADKVKGITIDFGVETAKFNSGIQSMLTQLKSIQKALSEVDKQLKFDPTNAILLKQRLSVLSDEVKELAKEEKILTEKVKEANKELLNGNIPSDKIQNYKNNLSTLTVQLEKTKLQHKYYVQELVDTEKALNDGTYAIEKFGKKAEESAVKTQALGTMIGNLASDAVKAGISALTSALKEIVSTGFEYNKTIETYTTSFKALLSGSEDADKAANNLIETMKNISSKTLFSTDTLLGAAQSLISTGSSAEYTTKTITALAKSLAYAGKGNDELKRMAQNLNQIKNLGKAMTTDLNQFAYAGIPIYSLLADYSEKFANGVDTNENPAMYEDIINALLKASEVGGQFADAFEIGANTMQVQLGQLETKWKTFAGLITQSGTEALSGTLLPVANDMLQNIIDNIQSGELSETAINIQEAVGNVVEWLQSEGMKQVFQDFKNMLVTLTEILKGMTEFEKKTGLVRTAVDILVQGLNIALGVVQTIVSVLNGTFTKTQQYKDLADRMANDYAANGYRSSGFGALNSGGFNSGGITLNASFSITNGNNIGKDTVKMWASVLADQINEELGSRI